MADTMGFKKIVLPLPGCGAGGLKPWKVLPILNKYFDERFTICVKEEPYPNYVDFLTFLAENNGKLLDAFMSEKDIQWAIQTLKEVKSENKHEGCCELYKILMGKFVYYEIGGDNYKGGLKID
ncbi:MAG: hypothetical protein QXY47_06240 [Thermoplasmata archaeon]